MYSFLKTNIVFVFQVFKLIKQHHFSRCKIKHFK